jgi:hypothetical protein
MNAAEQTSAGQATWLAMGLIQMTSPTCHRWGGSRPRQFEIIAMMWPNSGILDNLLKIHRGWVNIYRNHLLSYSSAETMQQLVGTISYSSFADNF